MRPIVHPRHVDRDTRVGLRSPAWRRLVSPIGEPPAISSGSAGSARPCAVGGAERATRRGEGGRVRRILLDTDLAMGVAGSDVDDGFALALALADPEIAVEMITTVNGNTDVDTAT